MMKVRNANTNIRADRTLLQQSFIRSFRALANRIPGFQLKGTPNWWDRSWPEPRQSIDNNLNIKSKIQALPNSEGLHDTELFDLSSVSQVLNEHNSGQHDHTVLLNMLLTIDQTLTSGCN